MTVRGMNTAVRVALAMAIGLSAGGCYAAGTLMHVAFGPPAVDAVYTPVKQSTLVLVENYQDPDASSADADMVAREVGEALHDHAELDVVDPDKLVPLRSEKPADFHDLSIPAVGRAVGAKQVVYVNLVESATTADPTGAAVHATATARVRVIEVATGKVLWPEGQPRGSELSANIDFDKYDSPQGARMRTELLSQLSDHIAKLFYTWKPDTEKESNDGTPGGT